MANVKNLKGVTESVSGVKCFVSVNEPEAYKAARKKFKPFLDEIRKENLTRRPAQRIKACLVDKRFFVNNKPFVVVIQPPSPAETLRVNETQETLLENLQFLESRVHQVQGNIFRGYAISLSKLHSVHLAYCKLRGIFPSRDHIMMAYKISAAKGSCDDGEYFGDLQIADMIAEQTKTDLAIFIVRSAGRKLGSKRFDIIRTITQELLTNSENQELSDETVVEWDIKQQSLADILQLPGPVSSTEVPEDSDNIVNQEEMELGSIHSDAND